MILAKALKDKRIRDWIIAHREEVTDNPDAQDLIYAARHNVTVKYVKAENQAKIVEIIKPLLSEEEADVLRRGRNAKPHTTAKNASISDYHKATGLEALVGYLYLAGRTDRMLELMKIGFDGLD